jgi:hypothetical protein
MRILAAVTALSLLVTAGTVAALVLERERPAFTFAVDDGVCACRFDDDATAWDFGRNRQRVKRTVCAW